MWMMEKQYGADLEQMSPAINRKSTEVGGSYTGTLIDPATEALVLPPDIGGSFKLKDIRNVN